MSVVMSVVGMVIDSDTAIRLNDLLALKGDTPLSIANMLDTLL